MRQQVPVGGTRWVYTRKIGFPGNSFDLVNENVLDQPSPKNVVTDSGGSSMGKDCSGADRWPSEQYESDGDVR